MGDRISISFVKGKDESVVLFSHWGGRRFMAQAVEYIQDLKQELAKKTDKVSGPLDRLEPETVMVDFIRHLTCDMGRVDSDLYIGATQEDGDNSDNGHWQIDVVEGNVVI